MNLYSFISKLLQISWLWLSFIMESLANNLDLFKIFRKQVVVGSYRNGKNLSNTIQIYFCCKLGTK